MAKETLIKNNTKTGRMKGQKIKSIFDKYRRKIIYMDSKKISKKNIIDTIGVGTPQGLGQYLNTINQKKDKVTKQKQNKTYIQNRDLSIGVDMGISLM